MADLLVLDIVISLMIVNLIGYVKSREIVGGLVRFISNGNIKSIKFTGNIEGEINVGQLIGWSLKFNLKNISKENAGLI